MYTAIVTSSHGPFVSKIFATLPCYVQGNKSISKEIICSSYTWMTNDLDDPKVTSTSHY